MVKVFVRLESLNQALDRLDESLELLKNSKYSELHSSLRDSTIKRFDLSYDLFWKYTRDVLEDIFGISAKSPRAVFDTLLMQGFIDREQQATLLDMLSDRNLSTHTYEEQLAEELIKRVEQYAVLMDKIKTMINQKIEQLGK